MIQFRCQVIDHDGVRHELVRRASDETMMLRELMAEGYTPLGLRSGQKTLIERLNQPIRTGGGNADQAIILRQLAILVNAGIPVDRSLDLLGDQIERRASRLMLQRMLADIRAGRSLADAIESVGTFPTWVTGLLRSAESGGHIGQVLTDAADRMTKMAETRRRLVTALIYPAAVLCMAIVALAIILTLVIPEFQPVFEGEEARLPLLTRLVLDLSQIGLRFGLMSAFSVIAAIGLLAIWIRSSAGQTLRNSKPFLFPGQRLRNQYVVAQFCGLLSTLLLNGVDAVRALQLAAESLTSPRWRTQLNIALQKVREGQAVSRALGAAPAIPHTVLRMIEVGENSGQLGRTCHEAARIMNEISGQRIERIVSLVNPIAILLLGGLVAMLVAGVMLGIFALGDVAI
jgi:type II secretory pathway component PulF